MLKRILGMTMILAIFAFQANAAVIQATIGGKNASDNYHFTVDADGVMEAADGSVIKLGGIERTSWNTNYSYKVDGSPSTWYTLTSADDGTTFITYTAANARYYLPDCATDQWEMSFVSATSKTTTIMTNNASDKIMMLHLDAGDDVTSPTATDASTGASITLRCQTTNMIIPVQLNGTWTDSGAL
jgi:hypothetical protein